MSSVCSCIWEDIWLYCWGVKSLDGGGPLSAKGLRALGGIVWPTWILGKFLPEEREGRRFLRHLGKHGVLVAFLTAAMNWPNKKQHMEGFILFSSPLERHSPSWWEGCGGQNVRQLVAHCVCSREWREGDGCWCCCCLSMSLLCSF